MKRVYIVDDSMEIRQRLIGLLSETPSISVVGQAETAEAALKEIENVRPDTLLLDISLPGKSGIALLKEVKQRQPEIKVIIMTNYDYPFYRRQCLKAGADSFFNKTWEFETLIEGLLQ